MGYSEKFEACGGEVRLVLEGANCSGADIKQAYNDFPEPVQRVDAIRCGSKMGVNLADI